MPIIHILYDDYNSVIPKDQDVIGTITTNIGHKALRNGYKLIEIDMDKTICLNSKVDGKQPSLQDRIYSTDGVATAITTSFHPNIAEVIQVGNIVDDTNIGFKNPQRGREPKILTSKRTEFGKAIRKQYENGEIKISRHDMTEMVPREDGVSNTLTSVQKDNLLVEPINADEQGLCRPLKAQYFKNGKANFLKTEGGTFAATGVIEYAEPLRIPQATKQGYIEVQQGGVFDGSYPKSTTRRGRVQDGGELSPTLTTSGDNINRYEGMQVEQIGDKVVETSYRIRKLTPRECFRLMGVDDKDIDTIQASGVSNSQQYKMAGNSIVVDCLYHLFRKMFTETESEEAQLTLF